MLCHLSHEFLSEEACEPLRGLPLGICAYKCICTSMCICTYRDAYRIVGRNLCLFVVRLYKRSAEHVDHAEGRVGVMSRRQPK